MCRTIDGFLLHNVDSTFFYFLPANFIFCIVENNWVDGF